MSEEEETVEEKFAIIIPSEADMTALISAGSEYTKLYIKSLKKFNQLAEQTRVIRVPDPMDDSKEIITIIDNPDLKWWFNQCCKIVADVAKLSANIQQKDMDQKIKLSEMFINSGIMTKEQEEAFVKMAIDNKLRKNNE